MRRKRWIASLLFLFTVTAAGYVWGQIRARVDLVVVPVSVRDAQGNLITGLKKEDFIILEDGKPQTISSFDVEPQPLSAAIVVDDGVSGDKLNRLFPLFGESLLLTLTSGFGPEDEMAAYRYDHFVEKLCGFTSDHEAIQKSFDVLRTIAATRPDEPPDMLGEHGPKILRSLLNILGNGANGGGAANGGKPPDPTSVDAHKSSARPSSRVMHDAIWQAAMELKDRSVTDGPHRRKIIFLISDGEVRGANVHKFEDTTDLLMRNEIQVYGVSVNFATFGSFGALSTYATATGGDVFPGTSARSMEAAFGRVTEQARNQYELAYFSGNRAGSTEVFRTIDVETRFPGQMVTHRKGYVQVPTATLPTSR